MDAFGIMGMTFGMMGMSFGLMAWVQIQGVAKELAEVKELLGKCEVSKEGASIDP